MPSPPFAEQFEKLTGNPPFPWQEALYERFIAGDIPSSCSLPTGLGKTLVLAIWMIALNQKPDLIPRRLVYVVNRRTVVDQTTQEAEKLRENAPKAGLLPPAISTLRGQFADNRDWSADPSKPAIICGTVDMIGSRLLFNGYGVGRNNKPLHAGFLGQDVLLVHDEAHLEPAFQILIQTIEAEQARCKEFKMFKVMELTATSRGSDHTFELTDAEKDVPKSFAMDSSSPPIHSVWQRLTAKKGISFFPADKKTLAESIGIRARENWYDSGKAILIFVRTIKDVETVRDELTKKKKEGVPGIPEEQIQVLTGTMRGLERDRLVQNDQVFARFIPSKPQSSKLKKEGTVYLICTSAGEVGVDISADHLLCDLTPLDSMAQRLGRVNRRGEGNAMVDIFYEINPQEKPSSPEYETARWETKKFLESLEPIKSNPDRFDGSPLSLGAKMRGLDQTQRERKFTPPPKILQTSEFLFNAWSFTTIREMMPGRSPIDPFLHGITEEETATEIAWRREVSDLDRFDVSPSDLEEILEVYPLKPHELLRGSTFSKGGVLEHLDLIAERCPTEPVWLIDSFGTITKLTLEKLVEKTKQKARVLNIANRTIVLPPSVGGLSTNGLLNGKLPATAEIAYDVADEWRNPEGLLRQRNWPGQKKDSLLTHFKCIHELEFPNPNDEDDTLIYQWWVKSSLDSNNYRSSQPVKLDKHLKDIHQIAMEMVDRLNLSEPVRSAVIIAAQYHDLGKNRKLWQRSIGNNDPRIILAKSGGKMKGRELNHYRHEFGSLHDVIHQNEFKELDVDSQELVLHLIAAHHGRARPHFPPDEAFDPEPKGLELSTIADEVPLRFARLQKRFGRWGLAYLESLLRAADILASQKAEKEGEQ